MMRTSFCLSPRGDSASSRRIYEAIATGCIPVIIADRLQLPFSRRLAWPSFSVRLTEAAALKDPLSILRVVRRRHPHSALLLLCLLAPPRPLRPWAQIRAIPPERVAAMRAALLRVRPHFLFHLDPSRLASPPAPPSAPRPSAGSLAPPPLSPPPPPRTLRRPASTAGRAPWTRSCRTFARGRRHTSRPRPGRRRSAVPCELYVGPVCTNPLEMKSGRCSDEILVHGTTRPLQHRTRWRAHAETVQRHEIDSRAQRVHGARRRPHRGCHGGS